MGAFRLEADDRPLHLPESSRRVLAFLALVRKPLARAYVAGQLWPDSSDQHAGANLRSALWRLRRSGARGTVSGDRELVLAKSVQVDARRIAALVHRLLEDDVSASPAEAIELCESDDLLPDWYDDWLSIERERFRQLRLHGLERLCERLIAEGRLHEALEAGLAAVRAEPLRESAHRVMIGVHLAEGNLSEALRQYATCERLMSEVLGMRPTGQARARLHEGVVVRGVRHPGVPA
jgi:DNA-binding SARP family transcriptional activator